MSYSVGEMARMLGVAPSTLRYYDREGLLPFVERTEGGNRAFKDEDLPWLRTIECLKRTGMQLRDIRSFIHMCLEGPSTIGGRRELCERQREAVQRQIADLEETLATIDYKCWYYATAEQLGSTDAVERLTEEEIPEQHRAARRGIHS
ncbi:MAG: MerR family transcriptional regulator [Clostridia bacterium]|nr:MerR family transcriptional regulator [Clostridia bacterium]MBQ3077893.1 MerR family transcriptional regulator [Clostridia bacterium]